MRKNFNRIFLKITFSNAVSTSEKTVFAQKNDAQKSCLPQKMLRKNERFYAERNMMGASETEI